MSGYDEAATPPLTIVAERQRGMARTVGDLVRWRNGRDGQPGVDTTIALHGRRIEDLEREFQDVLHAVDALRKVILGFAISVALSSIVFALSILVSTGKIGG